MTSGEMHSIEAFPHMENLPRTIYVVRAGFFNGLDDVLGHSAISALKAFIDANYVPSGVPLLLLLDQRKLPYETEFHCIADWREVIEAIKTLEVRGAPAIGIAGAAAVMLRASEFCYARADEHREGAEDFERVFVIDESSYDPDMYLVGMEYAANMVARCRPTAVNLRYEVDRAIDIVKQCVSAGKLPEETRDMLYEHVLALISADEEANRIMGAYGAALIEEDSTVLTHCNAGSLATAYYGTALGVIYAAAEAGKIVRVYADETRPAGQGSRLTVWELSQAKIPVTLICDNMAATVLSTSRIDAVIVGADRVAANGDVANKIGTLGVAVLAHHFGVPFYVACPTSTIDPNTATGKDIPIEERDEREVLPAAIEGVDVFNPAFDVTPAALITKIITQRGVFAPEDVLSALD